MQAWVVFFFKNIAQTLTVRVNVVKSESACFFLRAQEISLKDFWECATLYSSVLLEFN